MMDKNYFQINKIINKIQRFVNNKNYKVCNNKDIVKNLFQTLLEKTQFEKCNINFSIIFNI